MSENAESVYTGEGFVMAVCTQEILDALKTKEIHDWPKEKLLEITVKALTGKSLGVTV